MQVEPEYRRAQPFVSPAKRSGLLSLITSGVAQVGVAIDSRRQDGSAPGQHRSGSGRLCARW